MAWISAIPLGAVEARDVATNRRAGEKAENVVVVVNHLAAGDRTTSGACGRCGERDLPDTHDVGKCSVIGGAGLSAVDR